MARVTILPSQIFIETAPGESLKDGLSRAGLELETPCNGDGRCGQCRIWVKKPHNIPETPHKNISSEQAAKGLRLACQVYPEDDLYINIPREIANDTTQIITDGVAFQTSKAPMKLEPAVHINESEGKYYIQHENNPKQSKLENWEWGFLPKGLAIDLGTTTVVATLISLMSGKELATASILNPQIKFGHDIMTRIHKGSTPEGLDELASVIREGINRLIRDLCSDSDSDPMEIIDVVIGGNTTMLQLVAKIDPSPLGKMPFETGINGGEYFPIEDFGIYVNPASKVYVPPIAHAFVGSDVSAGLLACSGFFENNGSTLFVDAGTNGELGISANGKWVVTSTAAGPAFEGMGISCGMRAGVGAIESVVSEHDSVTFDTVGNIPARGICGSGIIDLVSCLLHFSVIEYTGRMRHPSETDGIPEKVAINMQKVDDLATFELAEGVYFTQKDVRQVQMAKGAIRAAIDLFIKETDITPDSVSNVVLAGGFGYSLVPESLEAIGMIPEGMADRVFFAGNTSRLGCVQLLRDVSRRRFIEERMSRVEHISLAERPEFMERYVDSMQFPEISE